MSDKIMLRIALALLAVLVAVGVSHCPASAGEPGPSLETSAPIVPASSAAALPDARAPKAPAMTNLAALPDTCSRVVVRVTDAGPRLSKERPAWLRSARSRWEHQRKMRELIRLVASEMGADELVAEMIWRKAISESSGNPAAIHLLSPDLDANRSAARHRRKSERWSRAAIPVWAERRGDLERVGLTGAWSFGRGLYGQVSGLHAKRWPEAPPWWICDPVASTVSVIWAMRAGLEECDGESLRDAHRRFAFGFCAERPRRLERRFDRLARGDVRGLDLDRFDPDAPAVLGDRWREDRLDGRGRARLHALLTARAREHGLMP